MGRVGQRGIGGSFRSAIGPAATVAAVALHACVLLAPISGASWAEARSPEPIPGGMDDPNVDKYTGSVEMSVSLGRLHHPSSPAYELSASYGNRVNETLKTWNREVDTGVLGIGWVFPSAKIVRATKGTYTAEDDTFMLFWRNQTIKLRYVDAAGQGAHRYESEGAYSNWRYLRLAANQERGGLWQVTTDDGEILVFGGDTPADLSDDDPAFDQACGLLEDAAAREPSEDGSFHPLADQCRGGAIEVSVAWAGGFGVSASAAGQVQVETAWNLSAITDVWGNSTRFGYVQHMQNVGPLEGAKAYTKAIYLYKVEQGNGDALRVFYGPKTGYGGNAPYIAPGNAAREEQVRSGRSSGLRSCGDGSTGRLYGEYTDPWATTVEPDAYQERYTVLHVASVAKYKSGGRRPISRRMLSFCFLQGGEFLAGYEAQMTKRAMAAVVKQVPIEGTNEWQDAEPAMDFEYHDGTIEGYGGFLKSVTDPSGLRKDYAYARVEIDAVERTIEGISDRIHKTAMYGPNYLMVHGYRDDSSGAGHYLVTETLDSYRWTNLGWQVQSFEIGRSDVPVLIPKDPRAQVVLREDFFAYLGATIDDSVHLVVSDKNKVTGEWNLPSAIVHQDFSASGSMLVAGERYVAAYNPHSGTFSRAVTTSAGYSWKVVTTTEEPGARLVGGNHFVGLVRSTELKFVKDTTEGSRYDSTMEFESYVLSESGEWSGAHTAQDRISVATHVQRDWHSDGMIDSVDAARLHSLGDKIVAELRIRTKHADHERTLLHSFAIDGDGGGSTGIGQALNIGLDKGPDWFLTESEYMRDYVVVGDDVVVHAARLAQRAEDAAHVEEFYRNYCRYLYFDPGAKRWVARETWHEYEARDNVVVPGSDGNCGVGAGVASNGFAAFYREADDHKEHAPAPQPMTYSFLYFDANGEGHWQYVPTQPDPDRLELRRINPGRDVVAGLDVLLQLIGIAAMAPSLLEPAGWGFLALTGAQVGVEAALRRLPAYAVVPHAQSHSIADHYIFDGNIAFYREANGALTTTQRVNPSNRTVFAGPVAGRSGFIAYTLRHGSGLDETYEIHTRQLKNGNMGSATRAFPAHDRLVSRGPGDVLALSDNSSFLAYDRGPESAAERLCPSYSLSHDRYWLEGPCFYRSEGAYYIARVKDGTSEGGFEDYPVSRVMVTDGERYFTTSYGYGAEEDADCDAGETPPHVTYSDLRSGGEYQKVTVRFGAGPDGEGRTADGMAEHVFVNGSGCAKSYSTLSSENGAPRPAIANRRVGRLMGGAASEVRIFRAGDDPQEPRRVDTSVPVIEFGGPGAIILTLEERSELDGVERSVEKEYYAGEGETRQLRALETEYRSFDPIDGSVGIRRVREETTYAHQVPEYAAMKSANLLAPVYARTVIMEDDFRKETIAASVTTFRDWGGGRWAPQCSYRALDGDANWPPVAGAAASTCQQSSGWQLDGEVLKRHEVSGAATETRNWDGLVRQEWISNDANVVHIASFAGEYAPPDAIGSGSAGYFGGEAYEENPFVLTGEVSISDIGANSYSGVGYLLFKGEGAIRPRAYTASAGRPVIGAWIRFAESDASCRLGFSETDSRVWTPSDLQQGYWHYIQHISEAFGATSTLAPALECGRGVFADDIRYGTVSGGFSATVELLSDGLVDARHGPEGGNVHHVYDTEWRSPHVSYSDSNGALGERSRSILGVATTGLGRLGGYWRPDQFDASDVDPLPVDGRLTVAIADADGAVYLPNLGGPWDDALNDAGPRFVLAGLGFMATAARGSIRITSAGALSALEIAFDRAGRTFTVRQLSSAVEETSASLNQTPKELVLVVLDRSLFIYADGRQVLSVMNRLDPVAPGAAITFQNLILSNIVLGRDPLVRKEFSDARGNLVQSHTLAPRYVESRGALLENGEIDGVAFAQLFDGWGNPAAQTMMAGTGGCDAGRGGPLRYCPDFVTSFDWRLDGDGSMEGVIADYWGEHLPPGADGDDYRYAFSRSAYYPSQLKRKSAQSELPGAGFRIGGGLARGFGYQDEEGRGLMEYAGLPDHMQERFRTASSSGAFSERERLDVSRLADLGGRTLAVRSGNGQFGYIGRFQADEYNRVEDGADVAWRTMSLQPKGVDERRGEGDSQPEADGGYLSTREVRNLLGNHEVVTDPDADGELHVFRDGMGRVRFVRQNPDWSAASQGFSYWLYDRFGRLTERGVLRGIGLPGPGAYLDKALSDRTFPADDADKCVVARYRYDMVTPSPLDGDGVTQTLNASGRLFSTVKLLSGASDRPAAGEGCVDPAIGNEERAVVNYSRYDRHGRIAVAGLDVHETQGYWLFFGPPDYDDWGGGALISDAEQGLCLELDTETLSIGMEPCDGSKGAQRWQANFHLGSAYVGGYVLQPYGRHESCLYLSDDGEVRLSETCADLGSTVIVWFPLEDERHLQFAESGVCILAESGIAGAGRIVADRVCVHGERALLHADATLRLGQDGKTCAAAVTGQTGVEVRPCDPADPLQQFSYDEELRNIFSSDGRCIVALTSGSTNRAGLASGQSSCRSRSNWRVAPGGGFESTYNAHACLGGYGGDYLTAASCATLGEADRAGRALGQRQAGAVGELTRRRNTGYEYDNLGRMTRLIYPDVDRDEGDDLFETESQYSVRYRFDGITGRLRSIADEDTRFVSDRAYAIDGKLVQERLNEGSLLRTYDYDFARRMTRIAVEKADSGEVLFEQAMEFGDGDSMQGNNIVGAAFSGSALAPEGGDIAYDYDIWDRLRAAEQSGSDSAYYEYGIDPNGNLIEMRSVREGSLYSREFDHDESNRISRWREDGRDHAIGYDPAGAITSLEFPDRGVLTIRREAGTGRPLCFETPEGKTVRYSHDARGALMTRSVSDGAQCGTGTVR